MDLLEELAWQVCLDKTEIQATRDSKVLQGLLDLTVRKVSPAFLVRVEPQDLLVNEELQVSKDSVEMWGCLVQMEILDRLG